jgi:hypothetical protein
MTLPCGGGKTRGSVDFSLECLHSGLRLQFEAAIGGDATRRAEAIQLLLERADVGSPAPEQQ